MTQIFNRPYGASGAIANSAWGKAPPYNRGACGASGSNGWIAAGAGMTEPHWDQSERISRETGAE